MTAGSPADAESGARNALREVLTRARSVGFLGPGDIDAHITHALAFASALPRVPTAVVDLGSGGGIPGLALAVAVWTDAHFLLTEGSTKRGAFLSQAVEELGLVTRVEVSVQRAEVTGQAERWRGWADAVVSRSFGPPALVAECAAPFLQVGGHLLVSEPPATVDRGERWPASGLREVGLQWDDVVTGPPAIAVLTQVTVCPERYPRRIGIPSKRPLF